MSSPEAHTPRHPTFKQYVAIAIFLFAITIIEFMIIVPENFRGQGWTIAPLAILSAIKFAAVIFFYMHLKFDNRLLTWIFLGGLALGFAVVFSLVGLFGTLTPSPRAWAEANAKPCTLDHHEGGCLEDKGHVTPETRSLLPRNHPRQNLPSPNRRRRQRRPPAVDWPPPDGRYSLPGRAKALPLPA